jgi:uncharacterized protein
MLGNLSGKNSIRPTTSVSCFCLPPTIFIKQSLTMRSTGNLTESSKGLNPVNNILLFIVAIYRTAGSLFFGGSCRFEPSCSEYAVEALKKHRTMVAIKLISIRLSKCHPWGPHGYDPVPEGKRFE